MKLCLGTAQFGLDYGVRGNKRQTYDESITCIQMAVFKYGITMIDTASAYGDSEQLLGAFFSKNPECKKNVFVVSKLAPDALKNVSANKYESKIINQAENSLSRLNLDKLNGFLLHSATDIFQDKIIEALAILKKNGLVDNIGISVYEPEEAMAAVNNKFIDYIQVPYNIFDQRLDEIGFFKMANKNRKVIFARSVFLQGLLMMKKIPDYLSYSNPYVKKFQKICDSYSFTYSDACINYVLANVNIDYIVMGVDNPDEIERNVLALKTLPNMNFIDECKSSFKHLDRNILNPSLWKRG
jgi:aryl-alcohol dehydrogenase-like predicted oxidoreductase